MIQDHPRSCGKDTRSLRSTWKCLGSPPLVRERRYLRLFPSVSARITPARAGKTCQNYSPGIVGWDHPRSCGKDRIDVFDFNLQLGSPPLVRERRRSHPQIHEEKGITPARAGKTGVSLPRLCHRGDHPRSCGKDDSAFLRIKDGQGSPPLVRERQRHLRPHRGRNGITPARAGKTAFSAHPCTVHGDHPRSCGKDTVAEPSTFFVEGSPPLVRERRSVTSLIKGIARITPARAGKTKTLFCLTVVVGDHPRSCGKDVHDMQSVIQLMGSPPLVRERPNVPGS